MEVLGKLKVKVLLVNNLLSNLVTNLNIRVELPLKTSSGLMHGSYQMEDFNGESFEVSIPPFSLDVPNNNKKLN